mgnify:CR=1 FL=1
MLGCEPQILQSAWEGLADIADYVTRFSDIDKTIITTDAILNTIELLRSTSYPGSLHRNSVLQRVGYRKLLCDGCIYVHRVIAGAPVVYRIFNERQDYGWD